MRHAPFWNADGGKLAEMGRPARSVLFVVLSLGLLLAGATRLAAQTSDGAAREPADVSAAPQTASSGTQQAIDSMLDAVRQPETSAAAQWLKDRFPPRLHSVHFWLPDYQWFCLLAVIFLGFVADMVVRLTLLWLTKMWLRYIHVDVEARAERGIWRPVGLLTQALVWYGGTTVIGLPPRVLAVLLVGLKFFAIVAGVWTAFRIVDLLSEYLLRKARKTATRFDELIVPLVSKSLKMLAICAGVVVFADMFATDWTALLGGLGLGGAALALASKDALGNLFGSVTVLTDRPFEIGDWIKTSGIEGTVETVGLRSTRVRTFYNSQITLPNSLLTTAVVDNMGRRRYRRITETLGLQYDTTPEQVEAFCEGLRELIRRHPYTRKDYYHVYFNGFGDSSLNVMLYCFVECPDWAVELREKHRLYVDILKLAKTLGVSFAFPTRTVHLFQQQASDEPLPADLADASRAGQARAADIAGALLGPADRPGPVIFGGPTQLGGSMSEGEAGEG